MAAVVGVDAVAVVRYVYSGMIGLQIDISAGGVSGQRCPGRGLDVAIIEEGLGIVHGEMGAAVAAQAQGSGRLHHPGTNHRRIIRGQRAAGGVQGGPVDLQGAASCGGGGGAGAAMGLNVRILYDHIAVLICQDPGTLTGEIAASAAAEANIGVCNGEFLLANHHGVKRLLRGGKLKVVGAMGCHVAGEGDG